MKTIIISIGTILGFLIIRAFFLEPIEELGWTVFWEVIFNGNFRFRDIGDVLASSTFAKLVIGAVVGGILGLIVALKVENY